MSYFESTRLLICFCEGCRPGVVFLSRRRRGDPRPGSTECGATAVAFAVRPPPRLLLFFTPLIIFIMFVFILYLCGPTVVAW